jgi:hypothetical protein
MYIYYQCSTRQNKLRYLFNCHSVTVLHVCHQSKNKRGKKREWNNPSGRFFVQNLQNPKMPEFFAICWGVGPHLRSAPTLFEISGSATECLPDITEISKGKEEGTVYFSLLHYYNYASSSCEIIAFRTNVDRQESYDWNSAKSCVFIAHENVRVVLHPPPPIFHTIQSAQKNGIKKFSRHSSTNLISLRTTEIL